jgi:anti-sigma factor RsiW
VTACNDFEVLVSLRAAGALEPAEAARLDAHLQTCAACRAEVEADAEVLRLARLPAPTEAEQRATAGIAKGALAELHRREGRAYSWKRTTAAFAAAAAVLVAVLAPAVLGRRPALLPQGMDSGVPAVAASWQEPDLDTLWSDAGLVDDDSTSSEAETAADAALVAFDL